MPRIDETTKLQRLERISLLLSRNSRGLTEGEIADEVNLDRRTVNNYLRELYDQGKAYKDGIYWYPLVLRESRLRSFDLSPEEAVTLYLGARLLSKQQDKRNEPAETALLKLASVLKADAGVGQEIEQAARELAQRPVHEDYQPIFRDVVRGYIYRKKIEVAYRPLNRKPFVTTFSTYLLEPSPIGFTTYLIGHSSLPNALRAYKLERIESIRLTREEYSVPPDFPGLEILRTAWSIVTGEDTVRVILRFSPAVRARVLETRWHPSQEPPGDDPQRPGYLVWSVQVADTLDMLPWIRGWGADVEVLEPEGLRDALVYEAKSLAAVYQIEQMETRQIIYYAHTRDGKDESEWQRLIDHVTRVGEYAAEFGRDAGISELARIAGTIHDLGKYSHEFQKRLRGSKLRVDHATAGAKELVQLFRGTPREALATMLAYCISGHHTGLLDFGDSSDLPGDGTLQARLKTDVCDYSAYKTELDLTALSFPERLAIRPLKGQMGFSLGFLTRMIYSTLVDADFQETQEFVDGRKPRGGHESIETLREKLNEHLRQFDAPTSEINRKRTETLHACVKKASENPGFFRLTVPTGGGKTLASMAFALNHAAVHGLKRIIYVIPFTSIIEQNAGVFKDILGEENVLEHHSNFDWEKEKRKAAEADDQTLTVFSKLRLAAENWDIPIIVTTSVQFFESLFANKSSRCRKLHNIARSVIVFDEAQMFPRDHLIPAMGAVWELVTNYGASAVFCTATQPNLEKFLPENTPVTELAPNPQDLFEFYKRVEVKSLDRLPDDELIARLEDHEQVLCIVNTRKHASGLFEKLQREGRYHLSTLMCPAHRRQKLVEIRDRLEGGLRCRVVSTSVMEAGIDVDFPAGYRALTGLDSINQAAGRVNRNMKWTLGQMFIFEPESEFIKKTPRYVAQGVEVTRGVLRDHRSAPISIPAIQAYFEGLYSLRNPRDFDFQNIMGCFDSLQPKYKFATVAQNFRVIEDVTKTVIIPFNEAAGTLIEELKSTQFPLSTLRRLQPYTVSIYEAEFNALRSKGAILTIAEAYAVLNPDYVNEYYDPERGLLVPASGGGDGLFF